MEMRPFGAPAQTQLHSLKKVFPPSPSTALLMNGGRCSIRRRIRPAGSTLRACISDIGLCFLCWLALTTRLVTLFDDSFHESDFTPADRTAHPQSARQWRAVVYGRIQGSAACC